MEPLLFDMAKLAEELLLQNMTRGDILKRAIRQKTETNVIAEVDEMCFMGHIKADYQEYVFSEMMSNASTGKLSGEPSEDDIETGYELFYAMVFCPTMTFKLYTFIEQLLSNEAPRTIIQSIVLLFESGTVTDETSFNLAKQFYHVLTSTLDLQYGNIQWATSTASQMEAVMRKDWPFFNNFTDLLAQCLQGKKCNVVYQVYHNLGR